MPVRNKKIVFAVGLALTLLFCTGLVHASGKQPPPHKPTADECLACHGDSSLSHEVNGKAASLFVNPQSFKDSIHGGMFTCVDCHTDVTTLGHETAPGRSPAPVAMRTSRQL